MKIRIFILIAVIGALAVSLAGCSLFCKVQKNEGKVKGKIIVIGNVPFTKLAIKTDDDKVYILKCKPELEKELWKKQGYRYLVTFDNIEKDIRAPVLIVKEIVPIK
jgi:hypothetical protein